MKKIDKLVLNSYFGTFFLTSSVVLFMFLVQYMIKNFEHFVGKDIELWVFAKLFAYFALVMVPTALPLAVLLSSLMSFGSLGQHSELTAIKSAGISLPRILRPALIFIILVSLLSFWFNNNIVPYANLKAYSLLWDIKQTKPSLNLDEGIFYTGMEKYRIKVDKKRENSSLLEGIMIYNHEKNQGNTELITAQTGKMKNLGGKFLLMELHNGRSYSEVAAYRNIRRGEEYVSSQFDSANFLFSMKEFEMHNTDERLFGSHNIMKKISQLGHEKDSVQESYNKAIKKIPSRINQQYFYKKFDTLAVHSFREDRSKNIFHFASHQNFTENKMPPLRPLDSMNLQETVVALNAANNVKRVIDQSYYRKNSMNELLIDYAMQIHRKFAQALSVFIMFLIGACLGAIIKKGGLGMPVLISIIFFVIYYVITIMGDRFAQEGVISPQLGAWAANAVLLLIALFFFRQAYKDARLFELDYYNVLFSKRFGKKT